MATSPILSEICEKANRRYSLYLELGHEFSSLQVQEIRELDREISQLWRTRRAEGKIWMPRLREGKHSAGKYERRLREHSHGYY